MNQSGGVLIIADVWHNQWTGSALRQHELNIDVQVRNHNLLHLCICLQLSIYVLTLLKGLDQTTTSLYLVFLLSLAFSSAFW